MLTCKSPRKVMRWAFALGCQTLPKYSSKFSRHDFTLPQLFACLVLREHQHKSYRHIEVLLRDSPHWCREIGMKKTPDHNTLCRAFHALNLGRRQRKLLDRLTQWFAIAKQLGSIVAIDSSLYDTHHRSRSGPRSLLQEASARRSRHRPRKCASLPRRGFRSARRRVPRFPATRVRSAPRADGLRNR